MTWPKRNAVERRTPFPERPSRAVTRAGGRTTASGTPLDIRATGVEVDAELRAFIAQRMGFKLGKFALRVRRVLVRLVDESGARGAPAVACRIDVALESSRDVFVEHHADTSRTALDGAFDRVERAVSRQLQRERRMPRA